jgi:hypothetical protein
VPRLISIACLTGLLIATSALAATNGQFVSQRYHYSLTYPPHWEAVHATTSRISEGFPTEPQPAVDKFLSCGEDCAKGIDIVVYARKSAKALAAFAAQESAVLNARFGCTPHRRTKATVGGEQARVLEYSTCLGNYLVEYAVVHRGRAYDFYVLAPQGHERRDAATLATVLRSVRFR